MGKKIKCPKCKSENIKEIRYGLPDPEMLNKHERGEILLGGCEIMNEKWYCTDCNFRWEN